jgi:tetratricopeptide (TPR) repeat protein
VRMSLPVPNSPTPPNLSQSGQSSPLRKAPKLRYVIGLPLLVMLGIGVAIQGPPEIGRWKLAAALDLRAEGKKEQAFAQLTEAMRWFPDNPMLLLQRADWRLEDGQKDEAIADADRMLELGDESYSWLLVHSHFMQTAGEHQRAVEDWKKIDRESQRTGDPDRATALNGLAYAQALAEVDIDKALDNVNEALELAPGNSAILDTRGFLLYLKGGSSSLAAALKDMNLAVEDMDRRVGGSKRDTNESNKAADKFSLLQSRPKTLREALPNSDPITARESALRSAAVLHYHRALIFEALGRTAGAEADREAARKLIGKEPDETLF